MTRILVIMLCMLFLIGACTKNDTDVKNVVVPQFNMIEVTGGTFDQYVLDSKTGEVMQTFNHTLTSYSIGETEVSYELWYAVYTWAVQNGYHFEHPGRPGSGKAPDWDKTEERLIDEVKLFITMVQALPETAHDAKERLINEINRSMPRTAGGAPTGASDQPVTMISWCDAIVWCNALSEIEGLTPVYADASGSVLRDSRAHDGIMCNLASVDWNANGYRLPTEGEWKFAASNRGDKLPDTVNQGYLHYTKPVTSGEPNKLGLYGTTGNVWEWCWDWQSKYPDKKKTDYRGPETGSGKIHLGGQAYVDLHMMLGNRVGYPPSLGSRFFGFRLASSN